MPLNISDSPGDTHIPKLFFGKQVSPTFPHSNRGGGHSFEDS